MGAEEDSFGKDEAAAVHTRYQIQIFIPFNNRRSDKYLNAVKFLKKKNPSRAFPTIFFREPTVAWTHTHIGCTHTIPSSFWGFKRGICA